MNRQQWRFIQDWNAAGSSFANAKLDTVVNVSAYQHPSVVPGFNPSGSTVFTGDQLFGGSGGATLINSLSYTNLKWADLIPVAFTTQAGDAVQLTTTAALVAIQLAGVASSGMGFGSGQLGGAGAVFSNEIRNGALAQVFVDGVLTAAADTFQATPLINLFLDGASHVIKIVHSGSYNSSISPVGAITNTVGTSVGTAWAGSIVVLATPTFVAAKYRIQATASGVFSLFRTLPGAGETTLATGLTTGTLYTGSGSGGTGGASAPNIPGISFKLTGTLVNGDTAFITTDPTMLGVQSVTLYTSTGVTAGAYTSAVVDSGQTDTQWFLAEWVDNQPMASFALAVSQTATVVGGALTLVQDASYSSTTLTPGDKALPIAKTNLGTAGLMARPRGRYAQWTMTFPAISTSQPYFRDLSLYYWVPERDPNFVSKIALGSNWAMGPNLNATLGTLAAQLAATASAAGDFVGSYTISKAVDQYLSGYGADLGLPQFSSEQTQTYQARLSSTIANRQAGASVPDLAAKINILVNGVANAVTLSAPGVNPTSATCGGVIVKQTTLQQYSVDIPPYPYAGLPGLSATLAQTIIKQYIASLTSVNSVINPLNAGSYNVTFH